MRCLIVADLHYSLPQYDWLVAQAPRYDLVIIAGDHIDMSSAVDGRAQMVVVGKYLDLLKEKTQVYTCSGNHDLDGRDSEGEKVSQWINELNSRGIGSDDTSVESDGTLFTLCRWWDGPKAQIKLREQLARDAERPKKKWFWVHHAPAADSPVSWSGSKFVGDTVLMDWVKTFKPDMVFSGHIHQSPFTSAGSWVDRVGQSWVFNVGQHPGAPPAHLVFDSVANEVVWFSMMGVQSVKLDAPLIRPLPMLRALPDWLTSGDQARGQSPDRSSLPVG
ncbi:metallophosphoesterase family protein [Aestuariivirga litoralis]|uniref:metallophosphoesterase family protein n=1 Tax=Aestuariivirga litoralis TaxID=2650924 RepID=UPI0018C51563|nr:metallophosphoesterase [Aestuariivirga litoralis]MBG1233445.1 phosphohydrolase [Aestuariivirga litoralis]